MEYDELKKMSHGKLIKYFNSLSEGHEDYDDAHCAIQELQSSAAPTLTCCELAEQAVNTYFVGYDSDFSSIKAGTWRVNLVNDESVRKAIHFKVYDTAIAKFCSYCGTPVPKMVLKNPFPKNTRKVTDGGYYCDTCKSRLCNCNCLPESFAWEEE